MTPILSLRDVPKEKTASRHKANLDCVKDYLWPLAPFLSFQGICGRDKTSPYQRHGDHQPRHSILHVRDTSATVSRHLCLNIEPAALSRTHADGQRSLTGAYGDVGAEVRTQDTYEHMQSRPVDGPVQPVLFCKALAPQAYRKGQPTCAEARDTSVSASGAQGRAHP